MSLVQCTALRSLFRLALLSCIISGGVALAQLQWRSTERGTVPEIAAEINLVLTGGCWRRGESYGRYRFIVIQGGFEETFDVAYVQVMQVDLERGMETAVKTTPVIETEHNKYLVTLRDVALAPSSGSKCEDAVFTGRIVRRSRERTISTSDFRLRVYPDGSYSWSETPRGAVPSRHGSRGNSGGRP